ncbi:MAG: hypothetical protein M3252_03325 [Actinomycetota bacterium]|nr:hypothetical protein [Actinomycetota bacterium]
MSVWQRSDEHDAGSRRSSAGRGRAGAYERQAVSRERIQQAWRDGHPYYEVEAAWVGKKLVRSVYAAHDLEAAADRLDAFLDWADQSTSRS